MYQTYTLFTLFATFDPVLYNDLITEIWQGRVNPLLEDSKALYEPHRASGGMVWVKGNPS
jgi:hypothetical protein